MVKANEYNELNLSDIDLLKTEATIIKYVVENKEEVRSYADAFSSYPAKVILKLDEAAANDGHKLTKEDILASDVESIRGETSLKAFLDLGENVTDFNSFSAKLRLARTQSGRRNAIEVFESEYRRFLAGKEPDVLKLVKAMRYKNRGEDESKNQAKYISEVADDYLKKLTSRREKKLYTFGNYTMDKMIVRGPSPGTIGFISAQSGMGKSALCLNLVNNNIDAGVRAMYFPIEMGLENTLDRLIAMKAKVEFAKLQNNNSDPVEFDKCLSRAADVMATLSECKAFKIYDGAALSLAKLEEEIVKFQDECGEKYMIIYVDLLSMVSDFCYARPGENLAQTIEFKMNELHEMAQRLGVHIVGVLQMKREGENVRVLDIQDVEKIKPSRTDLKNANAWLERCRYLIGVHRPKAYAQMYLENAELTDMDDIMHLYVLKQNDGECAPKKMGYDGKYFLCSSILDEEDLLKASTSEMAQGLSEFVPIPEANPTVEAAPAEEQALAALAVDLS